MITTVDGQSLDIYEQYEAFSLEEDPLLRMEEGNGDFSRTVHFKKDKSHVKHTKK